MKVLRAKSERAREYRAGLVTATTVVVIAGAVAAVDPTADSPYWPGLAFALVCAVVLMFRSRTYAGAEQAVVLIAGGTAIVLLVLIGAALTQRQPLTIFGVALLLFAAALVLGILVPRQQATPPMRRAVELLEYAFVAAVVPLAFWVTDLYTLVRGL